MINDHLYERYSSIKELPYHQGNLIALFHEQGQVEHIEHDQGGVFIQGRIPGRLLARYVPYIQGS
jgi:GTP-binding protein HflX